MIQIVDENDNVIGHKERSSVDTNKEIYRVAALWVRNSKGEVLIAQRKITKDKDPGKWGPAVSGTVEEGETYESNIYKEAQEEIGLTGSKLKIGPKLRITAPRKYFCQVFSAVVDKDIDSFNPQKDEVEKLKWIPERELLEQLRINPDNFTVSTSKILNLFYK